MNPTPPREFVSALRAFDKDLRIRWGKRTHLWIIERKMPERDKQYLAERPNPWKSKRGWDCYDGWKEGYIHVLSVHPTLLDHQVFDVLREADTWRVGGMQKMSQKVDEQIAAQRAAEDRTIQNFNESASREAHDMLQWRLKNRLSMYQPGPIWIRGRDYVVKDRRRGAHQAAV